MIGENEAVAIQQTHRQLSRYIQQRRAEITGFLTSYLTQKEEELAVVGKLGRDACRRLLDFTTRGKMLRGALVSLASGLGKRSVKRRRIAVGAAMELFQSALLIHDDIMDRDESRRGTPSLFIQYANAGRLAGALDPDRMGESLAICAADIAFFLAFDILSSPPLPASTSRMLSALCARELSLVGAAQMVDVYSSLVTTEFPMERILNLYLHKTGRYTFSLPLVAGALLGGVSEPARSALERAGEQLGILFQIRDDHLDLYGDRKEFGRPAGSDVRENKRTLHRAMLLAGLPPSQRQQMLELFGKPELSDRQMEDIREAMRRSGAQTRVDEITSEVAERARGFITPLVREYPRAILLEQLLAYSLSRRS